MTILAQTHWGESYREAAASDNAKEQGVNFALGAIDKVPNLALAGSGKNVAQVSYRPVRRPGDKKLPTATRRVFGSPSPHRMGRGTG